MTSGRIIFVIPFIADLYRANSYFKRKSTLQKRRIGQLSDNMKEAHQTFDLISEIVIERINSTFSAVDKEKIVVLQLGSLVPNWCRNKAQLTKSLIHRHTLYPSLHQNYSFHGKRFGNTQLAGDILCTYLQSQLFLCITTMYFFSNSIIL